MNPKFSIRSDPLAMPPALVHAMLKVKGVNVAKPAGVPRLPRSRRWKSN